jgi:mono/diheme cytochrome c family protein
LPAPTPATIRALLRRLAKGNAAPPAPVTTDSMNAHAILLGTALLGLVAAGAADRPLAAAPGQPAARPAFDAALVARGARLAAIGNCAACHTRAGGKPFAGGLALATPFGTIYSTNITPDADTGIGWWTGEDFQRAMREGIDRAERHLYPAFPYDHFTRVNDADIAALYAFIVTRDPERAEVPANRLRFPAGFRPAIAAWKALYFEPGVYRPDPQHSAEWNRGAYLAEGLGHCGACHTPRNALGAEERQHALGGGDAEGWHASSLTQTSPAPVPWTVEQLVVYLRTGHEAQHGIAAGPMAPVVRNLAAVAPDDVRAIAIYIASRMRSEGANVPGRADSGLSAVRLATTDASAAVSGEGATIFAGACANCHSEAPPAAEHTSAPVALGLTTSLNAPDPRNAIHITLEGLWPDAGERGALMPGFAGELTDRQVIALVDYLRMRFTDRPAWTDVPERVREIRMAMKDAQ